MVEARDGLLPDGVGRGAQEAPEIQIRAGEVSRNAPASFRRPRPGRELNHSGGAVEEPAELEARRGIRVQVAGDPGLLQPRHSVDPMLSGPAKRCNCKEEKKNQNPLEKKGSRFIRNNIVAYPLWPRLIKPFPRKTHYGSPPVCLHNSQCIRVERGKKNPEHPAGCPAHLRHLTPYI